MVCDQRRSINRCLTTALSPSAARKARNVQQFRLVAWAVGLRGSIVVTEEATCPLAAPDAAVLSLSFNAVDQLVAKPLMVGLAMVMDHEVGRLAIGGNDRIARVFDLNSRTEEVRIPHDEAVWAVNFTPQGTLMTNQGFNVLRWHAVSARELISQACSRVSRSLTSDAWARYLVGEPYRSQCDPRR